jgi:glycosyltransferase involved in cell wall biosynthesis
MRILLLRQTFDPEPALKGLVFAKELVKHGHEVEVLTGFPNYPGGKVYPGYRIRSWQKESIDGISVIRVPLYPSHDQSGVRRVVNYSSFGLSSALLGPFLVRKPDVVYVYNLVTLGLASYIQRMLHGCKVVYDIQDLWPDSVTVSGMMPNRLVQKVLGKLCNSVYMRADRIVALSPGMKSTLVEHGLPSDKIDVIYNWCDEDAICFAADKNRSVKKELGFDGHFNVVFAGTMGKMQSLSSVLDAANMLRHSNPRVKFTFVGGGVDVETLMVRATQLRLPNVQFLPRRPTSEIGMVLSAADALLVHLKDDPLFGITIPSKIQAYLCVGRPVIVGVTGDAADLVTRAKAGISCRPEDSHSIADAVQRLASMDNAGLSELGANGRRFYDRELSFAAGVRQFDRVFRTALDDSGTKQCE